MYNEGRHRSRWGRLDHIDYEKPGGVSGNVVRFHAQYCQERPTQAVAPESNVNVCSSLGANLDGAENYVILETEGRGNVVGYFLNVDNVSHTWYGEGDDMIFVDGETWPPSFHGTGSEEIFGAGACPNMLYAGPYTGYLRVENADYQGETTSYRFYVADLIRFQRSIRMTIEHGHNNNFANHYSSTVFWYQTEPHPCFRRSRRSAIGCPGAWLPRSKRNEVAVPGRKSRTFMISGRQVQRGGLPMAH